jgi:hypothetical protein
VREQPASAQAATAQPPEGELLWHPLAEDGSLILTKPVQVEGYVTKDGQRFAQFKDPDTGVTKWWPANQMQAQAAGVVGGELHATHCGTPR